MFMMRTIPRERLLATTLILVAASLTACGSREPATNAPSPAPDTPAQSTPLSSPLTGFAKDLAYIKNGRFSYIWVFSRKDGKPLDKEDSTFLRTKAPQVVDWVITDEGKKVIAGTNFNLEEGNLALLKKRFNAEDYTGK
ncbi:MAG TPA: hypothetical protein VLA93_13845 [Pyrinomonadaceae bacterium]|nr:hypothetical protein [Pyrinomonadaceae bacterium]